MAAVILTLVGILILVCNFPYACVNTGRCTHPILRDGEYSSSMVGLAGAYKRHPRALAGTIAGVLIITIGLVLMAIEWR